MKNIFCRLGFHRPNKYEYIKVTRRHTNGKKYHRNYVFCEKCGKRLYSFRTQKKGDSE